MYPKISGLDSLEVLAWKRVRDESRHLIYILKAGSGEVKYQTRSESVKNLFSAPVGYHLQIYQNFPFLLNDFLWWILQNSIKQFFNLLHLLSGEKYITEEGHRNADLAFLYEVKSVLEQRNMCNRGMRGRKKSQ